MFNQYLDNLLKGAWKDYSRNNLTLPDATERRLRLYGYNLRVEEVDRAYKISLGLVGFEKPVIERFVEYK